MRGAVIALAAGLLVGCHFDSSASVAGDGDGGPLDGDGGGGGPDGGPCAESIHTELTVNGASGAEEPLVTVLIGDSIRLSAAGSCTKAGAIEYAWSVSGDGDGDAVEGTAAPDLASQVVDIYPLAPGDYTVTLAVGDGASTGDPLSVLGFRAIGWQVSGEAIDVRDLDTTTGTMWLATSGAAYQLPLADVLGTPVLVNDLAGGDDIIPNDLSAVATGLGGTVWFGHKPKDTSVWRVDVDNGRATAIDFSAAFGGDAMVEDIGRGETGIVIATHDGVSAAPDNQTFETPLITLQSFALTRGGSGGWAGGARLYRLPAGNQYDLFGVDDNKIRALLEVDGEIWAGSDDQGVALFDSGTLTVTDNFTVDGDGLPSDKVRAIAVDTTGDLWVATQAGVARYKRDRAVWVAMGAASGLGAATDITAMTTAGTGASRKIIAGTRQGVALLTLP